MNVVAFQRDNEHATARQVPRWRQARAIRTLVSVQASARGLPDAWVLILAQQAVTHFLMDGHSADQVLDAAELQIELSTHSLPRITKVPQAPEAYPANQAPAQRGPWALIGYGVLFVALLVGGFVIAAHDPWWLSREASRILGDAP